MRERLSIVFDEKEVWVSYEDVLLVMLEYNVQPRQVAERAKSMKGVEIAFFTDHHGLLQGRPVKRGERFVLFADILMLVNDHHVCEVYIVKTVDSILGNDHPWRTNYEQILRDRIATDFQVYLKVFDQYMSNDRANVESVKRDVNVLIEAATQCRYSQSWQELQLSSYFFRRATDILLQNV
ncbi:PiGVORF4-like protein [Hyphantria cunea granulovirus]|uniref:PiGVORF4-like protein n=1 Tax=Hyphantria cunea granulovirus TaxID=307448 RepID=A0AAF1D248_9BBAC|nr:PiGVORF4-like protein [Hyphantria cunea granulovirus]QBQ01558.1 PiGVORF4-like protein [Hyphantria cunea granulovirus]